MTHNPAVEQPTIAVAVTIEGWQVLAAGGES
jgi:hypothetical protein